MDSATHAELIALLTPIVANPTAWAELDDATRNAFRKLKGDPNFDDDQRMYLSRWWLPVDTETTEQLNALAPPNFAVAVRVDVDGNEWVCADLLTDAEDGGPLSAMLPVLETLPLNYKTAEHWPVSESEEE